MWFENPSSRFGSTSGGNSWEVLLRTQLNWTQHFGGCLRYRFHVQQQVTSSVSSQFNLFPVETRPLLFLCMAFADVSVKNAKQENWCDHKNTGCLRADVHEIGQLSVALCARRALCDVDFTSFSNTMHQIYRHLYSDGGICLYGMNLKCVQIRLVNV